LLADDEETFRLAAVGLLKEAGFECDAVASGDGALELLSRGQYDLIISDINMAGNRELELIREFAGADPPIPIILITGFSSVRTAVEAIRLKVSAYLLKPVDPVELVGKAREAVQALRFGRRLSETRGRLQESLNALGVLETTMANQPSAISDPVTLYAGIVVTHLECGLRELGSLVEMLSRNAPPERLAALLEGAKPMILLDALRQAILVLENIRNNVKSKELGDLRRQLETLLRASRSEPCVDGTQERRG
jgi:CheY-like chemotaxis protein